MTLSNENKPLPLSDVRVASIKGVDGWSSVSVKINEREYRWDVEDEVAKELEKRLKNESL